MLARCLTSPSRLVPVGVIGRRASYSLRPSTFQTIPSRADWRYSISVCLGSVIASSSPRRTYACLVPPVAGYTLVATTPPVDDYLRLRADSGLTPRTTAQAVPALEGTWWGCHVIHDETGDVVAMGRVIGDGGWYFHIADMATLPGHQRRGLGDLVLGTLLEHIRGRRRARRVRVPDGRSSRPRALRAPRLHGGPGCLDRHGPRGRLTTNERRPRTVP